MRGKIIGILVLGFVGIAILLTLGNWQMNRLAWKEGVLTEIDARIAGPVSELPQTPDPTRDRFAPVQVSGNYTGEHLRVLVSQKQVGAGYRHIAVLVTSAGRIMIDRGFQSLLDDQAPRLTGDVAVEGNLHWPSEVDGYTPEPDLAKNIWFARDVDAMAKALNTRPVLVIARAVAPTDPAVSPLPVSSDAIPNDHLNYAITWFSLAIVWLGMTGFVVWRMTRRTDERQDT
ncbi:SURF1 family protein [Nereida sp. NH-UV-3]|uniref:SURF1 family protein n=1 Tax=Nereida TaxID=282198 RepID=UPI0036F25173